MNDKEDIKKVFTLILGDNIILKDNLVADEEIVFCTLIDKLDAAHKDDEALFELSGIDLTKSKEDLWFVIESLLSDRD